MYMNARMMQAAPGKAMDLLEAALNITQQIKDKLGVEYRVGTQVGGNPDIVGANAVWETLGGYQAFREALMADESISGALGDVGSLILSIEDQLVRVLAGPGEPAGFSALNRARIQLPRIAEAIPFGLEVCEFVEAKVGLKTGFLTAVTGDRSGVAWFSRYSSLDELASTNETLEADPEYLDLFKRSGDLYVDGSLESSIWQAHN